MRLPPRKKERPYMGNEFSTYRALLGCVVFFEQFRIFPEIRIGELIKSRIYTMGPFNSRIRELR